MALSEHEQKMLREIEQSLLAEDPQFGKSVAAESFGGPQGGVTLRGIAVIVIGLVLLVGGVAMSQISLWLVAVSVLGFMVMVAGGMWMLRSGGKSPVSVTSSHRTGSTSQGKLGERMEDNFRRRFEN
ncbi:MAG: DUF3040 domain-containing protein [Corynebacterium sp.]|uniref:DUF3040 domain-containing protein n=1 Tax=Corynebacterium sp. TaxID=1720 RepID=UPI0026DBE8D0|nr:DUF3040 domain-containing protein [Corynebacterium sp.]MDO4761447.1 DUF3040 domain-containing protein [Corynebacterium sp.]